MSEDNGSQMAGEQSDLSQEAVEQPMEEMLVESSEDAPEQTEAVEETDANSVVEPENIAAEDTLAEEAEDQAIDAESLSEVDDNQESVEQIEEQSELPVQENESQEVAEAIVQETEATEIDSTEDADQVDEAQPAVPQEPEDGRAWYVLHCYSGYENKVRHNLEQRIDSMGMKDRIFDVVVPTEEEIEVKEGKRRTVERRVFPGYILVNMVLTEESWYVVRNTPGVTSFVGQGNEPLPLRPEEVSQIIKRMEADAPRIKVTFKQGARVRIVDGPFNDFRGTVDEIDMERAKVRVMVNFFGRETPVELDFLQVEKA